MTIEGTIIVKIHFTGLYSDDDSESAILDAVFPEGWDGELDVEELDVDCFDD